MPDRSPSRKPIAPYLSGLVALFCYLGFIAGSFYWDDGWIVDLLKAHYPFFVGIPFAGMTAYFVVGTLENSRGPIELEMLGLRFKGASGPIIMWVVVFLSLIIAIRLTWGLAS